MKATLEKKLDIAHSLSVRIEEADENGETFCRTCGRRGHYKEMDCGHYISRRHRGTRWLRKNTTTQCTWCNRYNEGNKPRFTAYLIGKYGVGIIDELIRLSDKPTKFTDKEGEIMLNEYKKITKIQNFYKNNEQQGNKRRLLDRNAKNTR